MQKQKEIDSQVAITGCTLHAKLSAEFRNDARNLILRYCPDYEINLKRQQILHLKSTFLNKICFMKIIGKKLLLMQRVDMYIQSNIEDIYRQYIKQHPRKINANKSVYEVVMQDDLKREEEEYAKAKLHSKMMDIIEQWLQRKVIQLRLEFIKDVRTKNESNLHYYTKNYFMDTGIEKHIKWYSKGRRIDIREILMSELAKVRQRAKD